jgi:hypothetical protein
MILFCSGNEENTYLASSAFTYRPKYLLSSNRASVFIFVVFMFSSRQPPIQWVPEGLSLGVKRPGREANHSPPSSAEVKNARSYNSIPPIRLQGVVLS